MNERLVSRIPRAHLLYIHCIQCTDFQRFLRRDIYGRAVLSVGEFVMESGKLFTSRTPEQVRASSQSTVLCRPVRLESSREDGLCMVLPTKFRGEMLID